jgi:3,2-trans-enoyl-CoA isomerase
MAQFVTVDTSKPGYAVVTIAKEPVNSLDLALWAALRDALAVLEADPAVHAVIFASGVRKDVFSAGNDLAELYAPRTSFPQYQRFWVVQNEFLSSLYRSRLATVAAIRGACPAGGCAIALCCDHRLMTPDGHIGLNEVLLGIPVPKFWAQLMEKRIGNRAAEPLLLSGRFLSPQQAKEVGLVDELVPKEQLLGAAEQLAAQLVKLPGHARAATKLSMRGDYAQAWYQYALAEPEGAWRFLNQPATLKTLGGVLQRLSKNSSKL